MLNSLKLLDKELPKVALQKGDTLNVKVTSDKIIGRTLDVQFKIERDMIINHVYVEQKPSHGMKDSLVMTFGEI